MLTKEYLKNKNVLLRLDLDVPIKEGRVENDYRLRMVLPTIKLCLLHAKKTIIIGHLGRPKGEDASQSLVPVQNCLKSLLNQDILFIPSGISPGDRWEGESPLCIMENLRFDPREENNDREYAQILSEGADVYIYESFANYRPSASLTQIPEVLPTLTGIRFDEEVGTLKKLLDTPLHPSLLLASGVKLDKLEIINKIAPKFDQVILGGLLGKPEERTPDGLDLNEAMTAKIIKAIFESKSCVFNGPLGYFEDNLNTKATKAVLQALTAPQIFSVVGGGDTLAAISSLGFSYSSFNFVSTGGGAMLEFLATGTHPLLEVLKNVKLK